MYFLSRSYHQHNHHHQYYNRSSWITYMMVTVLVLSLLLLNGYHCEYKLSIIHNNDFHAHYLPIKSDNNAECSKDFQSNPECVAGVSRTVAKIKEISEKFQNDNNTNYLNLNAGDYFQGTAWYTLLRSEVVADFIKLMKHDVMTLGNHEFDDGVEELVKFINRVNNNTNTETESKLPIVCSNLIIDPISQLYGMIPKSIVLNRNGTKIAIIGYLTPSTKFSSNPGILIQFQDEIEAIQEEIDLLKDQHPDLKIFIGLGHSGYDRDLEIAEKINDLDLIVGGHSHTFLLDDDQPIPSSEIPQGPYPTIYEHHIKTSTINRNKSTLVVQAFAFGKYLGLLNLTFNDDGDIIQYQGEPIFLDFNSTTDPETNSLVNEYYAKISNLYNETYGVATEEFPIVNCRHQECALGNLITDAFVEYFEQLKNFTRNPQDECDLMAVINGGNIRTSLDEGLISYANILSTLPYRNSLGILRLNGSELIKIFEHSADQHDRGGFLQQSKSIKTVYNLKSDKSKKIVKKSQLIDLKVRCNGTWIPVDEQLNKSYSIIINNFLANHGDNFPINTENWLDYQLSDSDLLTLYIEKHFNITPKLENRITVNSSSNNFLKISLSLLIVIVNIFNLY